MLLRAIKQVLRFAQDDKIKRVNAKAGELRAEN
jgi:hypothetical protein